MKFYTNQIFHIYNQGNNKQTIFFSADNYHYFLWKMRAYLLPFGDLISWTLMPNHYHWQFYVKEVAIKRKVLWTHVDEVEQKRRLKKYGKKAFPVEAMKKRVGKADALVSLNEAIGTLQKSYTRAINKEKNWSGSVFRKPFKAKDGWIDEFITVKMKNGKDDYRFKLGTDYAYTNLIYIHANAKKAGLVKADVDWPYSSARDYAELRQGNLCNLEMGRKLMNNL